MGGLGSAGFVTGPAEGLAGLAWAAVGLLELAFGASEASLFIPCSTSFCPGWIV